MHKLLEIAMPEAVAPWAFVLYPAVSQVPYFPMAHVHV